MQHAKYLAPLDRELNPDIIRSLKLQSVFRIKEIKSIIRFRGVSPAIRSYNSNCSLRFVATKLVNFK